MNATPFNSPNQGDSTPATPLNISNTAAFDASAFAAISNDSSGNPVAARSSEILFIDRGVSGCEKIAASVAKARDVETVLIDRSSDGLQQITSHLQSRTGLQAIHIISDGANAQLTLGNTTIGAGDLAGNYSTALARIGNALADSGDILIYGCDLIGTADGEAFVRQFSELTGAYIGASNDVPAFAVETSSASGDPGQNSVVVTSVEGSAANIGSKLVTDYGTLIVDANGSYSFSVDSHHPQVLNLRSGDTLTGAFNYAVDDGRGESNTTTLAITITGGYDLPFVGATIPAQTGRDSGTVHFDISPFFGDPEGDTLTYSASGLPAGLSIDSFTGEISGTIAGHASQNTVDGDYTATVVAADSFGASASTTFRWAISNSAASGNKNVTSGEFAINRTPDRDASTSAASNRSVAPVGAVIAGDYGTLQLNPDGSYLYSINHSGSEVRLTGASTESFAYTINDGAGGQATADLTITIDGTKNVTTITGGVIPTQIDFAGNTISALDVAPAFNNAPGYNPPGYNPPGYNAPGSTQTRTYSASGLPAGLTIDPVSGLISGAIDYSASQHAANGVHAITISASDTHGLSVSTTFEWKIATPPTGAGDPLASATPGHPTGLSIGSINAETSGMIDSSVLQRGSLIAPATKVDGKGDSLQPSLTKTTTTVISVDGLASGVNRPVSGSNGGLFLIRPDGSYDFYPNGDFGLLAAGETVVTSVTYEISDGNGVTATATLEIKVSDINRQPVLTGSIPNQVSEDADPIAAVDVSSHLTDVGGSDSRKVRTNSLPAGIPSTGILTVTAINGIAIRPGQHRTLPSGAIVSLAVDGSIDYDPGGSLDSFAGGERAVDRFLYTVVDENGSIETAESVITIDSDFDSPVTV